jgi:O-acetyl-ADP-ribose deacetylase (regulator of RNase III)
LKGLKNIGVTHLLKLAHERRLKSIVFPAISSGIFGFSIDRCAKIMVSNAIEYLKGKAKLEKVVLYLFGKENFEITEKELKSLPEC